MMISSRLNPNVEHTSPASHAKATRELGWEPRPTEHFIARAAQNYLRRSRST